MLVERSMHESWLSNAFLLADEPGGTAVFVDSGAPLQPLLAAVERERVTPTHLLVTHGHADHVAGNDELAERFSLEIVTGPVETGGLKIDALATPASPSSSGTCASRATRCSGTRSAAAPRTRCVDP